MKNPRLEIQILDDLAKWCAMPTGESQNHIALCFKRFADFPDYVNHNLYFSRVNNAQHIPYKGVAVPVMTFCCDELAVHEVCCIGSARWTKHKPPKNDTLLLWMGTSPDSHFASTAGHIPSWLNGCFVIKDAESSVTALFTLVQMFVTWPIPQTACMVIIRESCHSPMQHLHNRCYCQKPLASEGTTYIVSFTVIEVAVNLLPLTPQRDCTWWYLSKRTKLYGFNMFHM